MSIADPNQPRARRGFAAMNPERRRERLLRPCGRTREDEA